MNLNEITMGMNPQEKEIYFKHMEKRHREEQEKLQVEKAQLKTYKESLIEDLMKRSPKYCYADLAKLSIRSLERIFDYQ